MSQDNAKLAEAISLPDAPAIVILPSAESRNYFAAGQVFLQKLISKLVLTDDACIQIKP